MNTVIEVENLTKTFGTVTALDELDLTVGRGEVAGFLGPNGAGKTTTIRVLLGLLRADAGRASVLGLDPWRDTVELHQRLAYVPGDVSLWPTLTGGEVIDLLCRLRGNVDPARRTELIDRFELDPRKKCRTYSKGNRQKVALIAGLATDVELLILDEPTSGLDPLMEQVFQRCIDEVKQQGRSVLLSSHILAEVEKLCDTVTIIRDGRAVETGTLEQLRHLTRSTITAATDRDAAPLAQLPGVHELRIERGRTVFEVDNAHLDEVIRALAEYGVRSLESAPPSLEELFLRHYGDSRESDPVGGAR
ncbi:MULTISPECIES: ABC transporter ATP-binding protein [unclassified Rhodococcus (in: high G+C Gram-positive bacteria)]|uniref:ABC transporter ATP-binding protein n=1 Tax=unclassified Rhodococcus (in: high G+C Gram-positive bacteria) TaxID=192944 RepID=UPI0002A2FC40|nr:MULTISPECIES: ABC transporter ATP-binding protein [unclassified Rhodococcus (in: high G+C Gram-positive bacteria)]ELB92287.1 ABC transporter [Rhodococcus wratislaviensis IFP 2016]MBC2637534.1 ABC transporter ATP-binding protein [Rhodococcus sp. 3A]MBC2898102.1 ABC transporter ATP-binding protein [Rhodococcus sp. 4CII]MBC2898134.1 ABC transporter ATP-binding protein [Rhodococcus sp. 4CII]